MTPSRRQFLLQSGALLAAQTRAEPPNLIVILADDLGFGDLACYGAPDMQTPHLDALVSSGVRFDNFYANCPVCSPTRAALLTGKYPDRVGVPGVIRTQPENDWGYLSPKAMLLPQSLRTVGYHTAIIGKWHLGLKSPNTPVERGFDLFQGFLGDMMDDYYHHRRHGNNYMRHNGETVDPRGHATDIFTGWTLDYLKARSQDKKKFFLYLAYNAPHDPIQPPPEYLARVRARENGITEKRAKLVALIEHMDYSIGRVMAALKNNGQARNTLVVFTSDNGGSLAAGASCGPWRGGKQDMYEGGLRVPACAVWPGRIEAGSRSAAVGLTMDIFPTMCEAAGARPPADLDGASLLPVMLKRAQAPAERDLVWMRREGGPPYQGRDYYAFRRGDWKLVQNNGFEPYQLFDLAADPGEKTDLAKKAPKIYRELWSALARHIQKAAATPWQGTYLE